MQATTILQGRYPTQAQGNLWQEHKERAGKKNRLFSGNGHASLLMAADQFYNTAVEVQEQAAHKAVERYERERRREWS
jgi:hypothetical protein